MATTAKFMQGQLGLNLDLGIADEQGAARGGYMRIKLIVGVICSSFWCNALIALDDMSDIDAGVEETMADSVAAKAEAKAASKRASKEKEETADAIKKAESARGAAEMKRQEAQRDLQKADQEIQAQRDQQTVLKAEIKKQQSSMQESERKTQVMTTKLEKTKIETQTLYTLRDENIAKIAEIDKQQQALEASTAAALQKLTQAKMDFEKSRAEQKMRSEKFAKNQAEQSQRRGALEAEAQQVNSRMPNSVAPPAPAVGRVVLGRNCRVFEKPDLKSKVLGTKRAGSGLTQTQPVNNWLAFPLRDGRKVFVEKSCI